MLSSILNIFPILILVGGILGVILAIRADAGRGMIAAIVGVIIIAIGISAVLIPIVNEANVSLDSLPDYMEYDDYYEVSDAVSDVTGSLEMVEQGGKTYVHAKGLGLGTYVLYGTTCTTIVEKAKLDVYLLIGQSNAAYLPYANVASTATPVAAPGTCYYYGTSDSPMYYGSHYSSPVYDTTFAKYGFWSMTSDTGGARIGGIDEVFAASIEPKTDTKTMVINGAVGGTSITTWVPGGTYYTYAQDVFTHAWASIDQALYSPTIRAYLWLQGESDSKLSVGMYMQDFILMHNALLGASFTSEGPFRCALLTQTQSSYSSNAALAQQALAQYNPTIYITNDLPESFTKSNGLMYDSVHYSQAGRNLIGKAIAAYYWDKVLN